MKKYVSRGITHLGFMILKEFLRKEAFDCTPYSIVVLQILVYHHCQDFLLFELIVFYLQYFLQNSLY